MYRIFVLILLSSIYIVQNEKVCLFEGCKCTTNRDNSIDVKCIPDLATNSSVFPKKSKISNQSSTINIFLINKFNVSKLPDGIFDGLSINNLIIGQNSLINISRNVFQGVKSVSMLRLIEKDLAFIEPKSFIYLNESLTEFGLTGGILHESLFNELVQLKNVQTLKLNGLNLEALDSKFSKLVKNLNYLSLSNNKIKSLNRKSFELCQNLISLDLNDNLVENLGDLLQAIKPAKELKELKLKNNRIQELIPFSGLINLEYLDLSYNRIENISSDVFKNLTQLNHLYLSGNKVKHLNNDLFFGLKNLMALILNNNYLENFPNVTDLNKLQILDLSNQNSNLKVLKNYVFERKNWFGNLLTVYLNFNDLTFENRSFCSRYSNKSQIISLDLSFESLKNIDKCMLKQLEINEFSKMTIKIETKNLNETKCDCDFWKASQIYNVNFFGLCNSNECDSVKFDEKYCADKFNCH